mgnify:FL=1
MKILYDIVEAVDFADLECKVSAKNGYGSNSVRAAARFKIRRNI